MLLTPLLDFLGSVYRERAEVEERLRELLSTLRGWDGAFPMLGALSAPDRDPSRGLESGRDAVGRRGR